MGKFVDFCKEHDTTILSCVAATSVIVTPILASKATIKALKRLEEDDMQDATRLDKFEEVVKYYIPTVATTLLAAACLLYSESLNRSKQKSLMTAYMTLQSLFNEYRRKTVEIYGEDAEKRIIKEINEDWSWLLDFQDIHEIRRFYDPGSKRYFEMSIYDFQQAEYGANRMYNFLGRLTLNELYEFFGLAPIEGGDHMGWSAYKDWECIGYSWIEFNYNKEETKDGIEAYVVEFNIEPTSDFEMYQY